MPSHSFDIDHAAEYGVECAILIHHFQHWIRVNRACNRNIREGRCWTYQTRKEMQAHFSYFTFDHIRRTCEKLVEMGVLTTNNFNKNKIDKTLWYAFVDEEKFGVSDKNSKNVYERQNCPSRGKIATPIPDNKTKDIKEREREGESEREENPEKGASPPDPPPLSFFGDHVKMKREEYEKLCKQHGKTMIDDLIDTMNNQIEAGKYSRPKKYYPALCNWMKNSKKWEKPKTTNASSRDWARIVQEKFASNDSILVGEKGITFYAGTTQYFLSYEEPGFRDKTLSILRKRNLSVEGLL